MAAGHLVRNVPPDQGRAGEGGGGGSEGGREDGRATTVLLISSSSFSFLCRRHSSSSLLPSLLLFQAKITEGVHGFLAVAVEEEGGDAGPEDEEEGEESEGLVEAEQSRGEGGREGEGPVVGRREGGRERWAG